MERIKEDIIKQERINITYLRFLTVLYGEYCNYYKNHPNMKLSFYEFSDLFIKWNTQLTISDMGD